ncbi:Uncharacterised protein [uncultured Clostridium sp.]|uniref:ATPase n=1 Tax=Paeniclostridium hominis TaxID=2764329 RepID=A0ABR7K4C0_9FIRM|nr:MULTISPECIES: hypothetical protein [Paeniclostridium]MDU1538816.1 hypothetical protein [Paeniclostridium sordellii]SCI73826.1 Uncharacterised protein [uncultured Clostridium sp.]MBC6003953.1 hypothetical protein [Paeniclostridium hominis]MDU2591526.1 hypothetical protein [Paeniclostridium sordellii]SCJ12341.1 Uncharacterised protein [uncultured Clostridium sp.]
MNIDLEIMELLEELESTINNASSIPFSHKSGIDKEEVLNIIADIKAILPEEVKQAVWINKERQKILNNANQDAEILIEQATKEAEQIIEKAMKETEDMKKNSEDIIKSYIDSDGLVVEAEEKAKAIIEKADYTAREIKLGSIRYADDVLEGLQYNLQNIMDEISTNRRELSE